MPVFLFRAGDMNNTSTGPVTTINHAAGSGLGFFGQGGLGTSVQVGTFQKSTVVVDSAGALFGWNAQNIQYLNANSGLINNSITGALNAIPNWQATLNIRFSGSPAMRTSNVKVWPYDRVASTNWPSSVTVAVAELQHVGVNNSGEKYSTTTSGLAVSATNTPWKTFQKTEITVGAPSAIALELYASPGPDGAHASGTGTIATQHDWYLAISASPDNIGSKSFGLWVELEYTEG